MWIMTPYGFFSIVCAHRWVGRTKTAHPDLMMIRARKHAHLVALQRRHPGLPEIITNEGTDYPYRIIAGRDTVMQAVAAIADAVDYTNFKDEAKRVSPKDTALHGFLMSIWSLGCKLTPARVRARLDRVYWDRNPWPAGGGDIGEKVAVSMMAEDSDKVPPMEDVLTEREWAEYNAHKN